MLHGFRYLCTLLSLVTCGTVAAANRPDVLAKLTIPAQMVDVFGQRVVYYESGRGDTLILLWNLNWDSNAWAQNLPELAKNYRVIALDLLGTGQSAKPLVDYKMDTWTDVIAEFMGVKGIPKATVVGAVMGVR